MIIKSDRTFGVEIEFIAPNKREFEKLSSKIHIEFDGSLRPHKYAGEYVSRILRGVHGENEIIRICEILKKHRVDVENPQTSVHVHIGLVDNDVRKKVRKVSKEIAKTGSGRYVAVSRAASRKLTRQHIAEVIALNGEHPVVEMAGLYLSEFSGIRYISMGLLKKEPSANFIFYEVFDGNKHFEEVKSVMYFYTLYSEQIRNLVSNSRKNGNMYCVPLGYAYTLGDIISCNSFNELEYMWCKGGSSGGRYNDSRYKDVNFLNVFRDRGTVEIRSHGGTIDPYKILMWVRLHQYIVDKCVEVGVSGLEPNGSDLNKSFINFIDDDLLREYVLRLWGYFSGVKLKK